MGYSVHITRAGDWWAAEEKPINENEWLGVVKQDSTLSVNEQNFYEYKLQGETVKRVYAVEWSEANDNNCLWWGRGKIECKNPSEEWLSKMVALAKCLHAQVVGDDGERYH